MPDKHPYLIELDTSIATIKSLRAEIIELRQLLVKTTASLEAAVSTIATINEVIPLLPSAVPAKRKRGRPIKVTDDSWMLAWFSETEAQFLATNKLKKPTDDAVLTWAFENIFLKHGLRASKARSPDFQKKLKRFKNRLGDARNPIVKTPIK